MGFNFEPGKIGTEALHFVRFRTGQTQEKRSHLSNEAIGALLAIHGLKPDADPVANQQAVLETVIEGHEAIAARLATEGEVAITEVGATKASAARVHLEMAKRLRMQLRRVGAKVLWANPAAFGTTFVAGVDADPELE